MPPLAHGCHSIPPISDKDDSLDLTVATVITEDLRSQLLDDTEEPSLDDDIRRVRASSVPPDALNIAISPTSTYSTSTGSSTMSASSFMGIENVIQEGNIAMQKEIDGNSRTVRNLEKAINEQTAAIKSVKEILETFVNYIRQYSREERRQHEKREDKRERERQDDVR